MLKQNLSPNSFPASPSPTQQAFMLVMNRDTCYLQLRIPTKRALTITVTVVLMTMTQFNPAFIETLLPLIETLWSLF